MATRNHTLAKALPEPIRKPLLAVATSRPAGYVLRPLIRDHVAIMMLHRFADHERGIVGHDPELLRNALGMLRREGVPLLSLRDVVRAIRAEQRVEGIVFTVDDGYDDFATAGAPVFQEFDCPVTVFLATGFLDGRDWHWWDKVDLALMQTDRPLDELRIATSTRIPLRTPADRSEAYQRILLALKQMPERRRHEEVQRIVQFLEVSLPEQAPEQRAPLTWEAVRSLSRRGVEFGPHTVTHPHLTTMSEADVTWEIGESYRRLREEVGDPTPVFCYPFGQPPDLCDTVTQVTRTLGLEAALTAVPGYVRPKPWKVDPYRLPRFSLPDTLVDLRQITVGFARLKQMVRGAMGQRNT